MKAFLGKLWGRPEVAYAPVVESAGAEAGAGAGWKGTATAFAAAAAAAIKSSTTKGVTVVVVAFLLVAVAISASWIHNGAAWGVLTSRSHNVPKQPEKTDVPNVPKLQARPITMTCPGPNQTAAPSCRTVVSPPFPTSLPPAPAPASNASRAAAAAAAVGAAPSCPEYFRWIHEDLRPWRSAGITRETLESARKFAAFRLVVLDGRVYVDTYHRVYQTRDTFTLWGILQLVNRYPGRVPDLDLMFNCEDPPTVRAADYPAPAPPPPLFRYCKDDSTVDIVFPDWSFWGWPEVDVKPWGTLLKEVEVENTKTEWKKRRPYAYWKGNQWVSDSRVDLMKCNGRRWKAELFTQDWVGERKNGFKSSNLATQCHHRYKIYVEGRSWSVSEKYILACDSPSLFVTTHFYDFFSRALTPGRHYWPIDEHDKCRSIKFAVDWGNSHQKEALAMGKAGSGFAQEELKMDYVYDYMLHLLTEYAKLLKYKPTVPEKATELCLESLACPEKEGGLMRAFLTESMERRTHAEEPCGLPSPYTPEELRELAAEKAASVKRVEELKAKSNKGRKGR